jgi:hypothetical protein
MVDGSIHFRKEKLGTVVSCYSMQYMGIWISELVTLCNSIINLDQSQPSIEIYLIILIATGTMS